MYSIMLDWLIDFNGVSTCLKLFYAWKLGNHLYLHFCVAVKEFWIFCFNILKSSGIDFLITILYDTGHEM